MENKRKVFCWHHSDKRRLEYFLSQGKVDCPNRSFLATHDLKPEDQIRFSVKVRNEGRGQILATAELASEEPHKLNDPRHEDYPFGVYLKNILPLSGTQLCTKYPIIKPPPMNPSHWE